MNKQIIFFDLETTGVSVTKDRIVSISAIKCDEQYNVLESKNILMNPTIPIPAGATEVHGITDEMVKGQPTFQGYSKAMANWFGDCVLAGYNIRGYDVPLLSEEFARCNITWPLPGYKIIDAFSIFKAREKRDLASALKFYAGETLEGAHNAENDNLATIKVFKGQLAMYQDLREMTVDQIHDYCILGKKSLDLAGKIGINDEGKAIYAFGKDAGKTVKENPSFALWMLKNDFPGETKTILRELLK